MPLFFIILFILLTFVYIFI